MNWISVKDQLPPLLTHVLFLYKDDYERERYRYLNYYSSMKVGWFYERMLCEDETEESLKDIIRYTGLDEPTHWMFLPKGPE